MPAENRLVLALAVAGFVLGAAALVGPWWTMTTGPIAGPPDVIVGYGPFGSSVTFSSPSTTVQQTMVVTGNSDAIPAYAFVFLGGVGLVSVGLLSAAAMATLLVAPAATPARRRRAVRLGLLASLLLVATAAEIAVLLPASLELMTGGGAPITTFWGSAVVGPSPGLLTWEAGWGWYAAVAAGAAFLAADLLLYRAQRRGAPAPAPPV